MTASRGDPAEGEARRLAALARYEVLGTPPEPTFDRIVGIVAAVFDVPVAMITLVGERQCWYKAEIGMGLPELPRHENMCDAVIAQDGVLVVDDTGRFPPEQVAPLLKRGMRFYAGAPLRARDGVKIGTVCAVGFSPRVVSEKERQILVDLAEIVVDELELRLAARRMREADARLRRLNRELRTASRNKSEFLANMSHELRTPLNGILGAAELLGEAILGPLNDRQREYVRDIERSGVHLLSLIDDVLDISRVEAGQVELQRDRVAVAPLMESCAAFVRGFATAKSIRMRLVPPPEPVAIDADERRTTQVICNLLSNALKFTPEGGLVEFSARNEGEDVVFLVQDEGPGIAPEYRERIFEQFFRVPGSHEGTGLGLPLSRRLVELQGGRIWLDCEAGPGSRFYFTLPAGDPQGL